MSNSNSANGDATGQAPKRSPVEAVKEASRQLRGSIADELGKDSDHFSDADKNLLKFHGTYQQEDRDARKARRKEGVGKHYMFMVRCKIPGGKLTAEQYLAVDDLADKYSYGTLRFTSRQGIQLHGVLKSNLHATIKGINNCLLTTLGACGDVERNVMCCPATFDSVRKKLQFWANRIAEHLAPRSGAYHEIWLNGEKQSDPQGPEEPIYGKAYLPRKFKTGLGIPYDNCVDIFAQDLGFLAHVQGEEITGFNVLVGGGMGMTHGNANTFPFVGRPICWIEPDAVVETAEATVKLFRDHGNRGDRKRARIKHLVHDWGVERFRAELAKYLPFPAIPPKPIEITAVDLHLGWHPQGDGRWFLGISIENGRVKDAGDLHLRTGLRKIIDRFRPKLSITPQQDLLLRDLDVSAKPEIDRLMAEHGILSEERIPLVQKYSMACPAIPTCALAISEAERTLPGIVDELEVLSRNLGLEQEKISVRMTGCPNGCVRPYQSDIGIVGRSGEKYTVFVGGHHLGTRLNFVLKDLVPQQEIVALLAPLLLDYRSERRDGEGFGDFCQRLGQEEIQRRAGVEAMAASH
ncbi:MAG TPA: NADPH-dependent assimilatory sulfite reductase hemoprotein subunit [Gemmataceae bacterium]|jgi:sulfite reductase (ferredoxin)|nr:NADPH-dependent assimilatory sulfite reductase hemoprotein subunit [Gemmataceae bacterium]